MAILLALGISFFVHSGPGTNPYLYRNHPVSYLFHVVFITPCGSWAQHLLYFDFLFLLEQLPVVDLVLLTFTKCTLIKNALLTFDCWKLFLCPCRMSWYSIWQRVRILDKSGFLQQPHVPRMFCNGGNIHDR